MNRKKLVTLISLMMIVGLILSACGNNNAANDKNQGNNTEKTSELAASQELRINLASEPPTLDPAQSQDNISSTVLRTMFEGLTRKDANNVDQPAVAEKWDISEDGKTYTFTLRQDAKWSNGDPVTAKDFEFSWKRVLDPATTPAPPYAYQLYYIKNAEAYNTEEIKDANEVGVKAIDEHTLQVTLENATPYFLGLTSFTTYYPVHEASVSNPKWANDPSTLVSNGPFKLSNWTTGQNIEVVKNDQYWDNANIALTKITASIVESGATEVSSYKSGELDIAGQPIGDIPTDQIAALKQELPDELKMQDTASIYFYQFNVTAEPFDNLKIRQAFTKAIDRQLIVDNVTLGGQKPATGFVPPGIKGVTEDFRTEHPDTAFQQEDVAEAKKLLEEGMAEKGITQLPTITMIYNTSDNHKKLALAVADMWKNNLGVEVKLQNQEWGVFLENRRNLNYQIARAGWLADYDDPMSFLDMWTSKSGNNDTGFSNPEYDELIDKAYKSSDNAERNDAMAKAENIFLNDNQVILPVYYYSNVELVKPYVKDLQIDYSGTLDLTRIKLLEH